MSGLVWVMYPLLELRNRPPNKPHVIKNIGEGWISKGLFPQAEPRAAVHPKTDGVHCSRQYKHQSWYISVSQSMLG